MDIQRLAFSDGRKQVAGEEAFVEPTIGVNLVSNRSFVFVLSKLHISVLPLNRSHYKPSVLHFDLGYACALCRCRFVTYG